MFTGLIREIATTQSFVGSKLTIQAKLQTNIGDSIAINGACLTVIEVKDGSFSVELSPESIKHLVVEKYKGAVHIEPAMQMGDRFEGHVVQGHIDAIGTITEIKNLGNSYDVFIQVEKKHLAFIVPKGSISIDGVSLTVNNVNGNIFRLTIIPHTMQETLFKNYKKGTKVNIETDMFARYIAHIVSHQTRSSSLSWEQIDTMHSSF